MRFRSPVEFSDCVAALVILAALDDIIEEPRQPVVLEELAIRRDIAVLDAVAVLYADLERIAFQVRGDLLDDVLNGNHALRPAESAKGRVRRQVRAADRAA